MEPRHGGPLHTTRAEGVVNHPLCSVEDRNHIAVAVDSGDLTRIVCGALRAISLCKHSGGMLVLVIPWS